MREETVTTEAEHRYTTNASKQDDSSTVGDAAHNLENDFAANASVVSQLTNTNTTLHNKVQNSIASLQEQMNSFTEALQHISFPRQHQNRTQPRVPSQTFGNAPAPMRQAPMRPFLAAH